MRITVLSDDIYKSTVDLVVFPVYEGEALAEGVAGTLNAKTDGLLGSLIERKEFQGKPNEFSYVHAAPGLAAKRLLLIGLGKSEKFHAGRLRELGGTAARVVKGKNLQTVAVFVRPEFDAGRAAQNLVEGFLIGSLDMDSYKSDQKQMKVTSLQLITSVEAQAEAQAGALRGQLLGEATNFARTLSNEPGSNLTPKDMTRHARRVASEGGLSIDVYGEQQMEEFQMGAILGVSRGSEQEAQLIVLRYEHPDASKDELVALIGKGITFDSGGLSLKTSEGMEKMKYDMSGASAVLGAMKAIAGLKPKVNVVGVMACSENMPSGKAMKPGDVLRSMSGRTIEVNNTDAEGRLVLADAITFARQSLGATHIVDVATLTGAASIAFGQVYAAVLGNDQAMIDSVIAVGKQAGERMWQLPLDEEYGEALKSDIADCRNSGGRPAGTINGAFFLKEFAGDTPWTHIDIASTGWNMDSKPYICKGPTGMAVRTMAEWVVARAE